MPEPRVNQKTLEAIFDSIGLVDGFGKIASDVHLVDDDARDVYVQDVVDAIRDIKEKKLVQHGVEMLSSCDSANVVSFGLDMKANHLHEGRFVPNLELEVRKSRNTYDGRKYVGTTYYCRLVYCKNTSVYRDFIFAQFDIPMENVRSVVKK